MLNKGDSHEFTNYFFLIFAFENSYH